MQERKPSPQPTTATVDTKSVVGNRSAERRERRDSVNVEGAVGFSDMLDEADRLILDGERGPVTIAHAKWGF